MSGKYINYLILSLVFGLVITTASLAAPATDDWATVTLLHMDSFVDSNVPDDDTVILDRNNDLTPYADPCGPTITTGDQGYYGEALSFNGTTQVAKLINYQGLYGWLGYKTFKVDVWIKPYDIGADPNDYRYVMQIAGAVNFFLRDGNVRFQYHNKANNQTIDLTAGVNVNQWNHVVATIDVNGHGVLTTDNGTASGDTNDGSWLSSSQEITIGCKKYGTGGTHYHFHGLIDELKISVLKKAGPTSAMQDDLAAFSVLPMDVVSSKVVDGETRNVIEDVNTLSPGRSNDFIFGAAPSGSFPEEPNLTTGGGGIFGEALQFSSLQKYMGWTNGWSGSDYLKFEAWVKPFDFSAARYSARAPVLLDVVSRVKVWYRGGVIRVAVRIPGGSYSSEYTIPVQSGAWDHITLEVRPDGTFTLDSLYGSVTGSTLAGGWNHAITSYIVLGADMSQTGSTKCFFQGLIDDVKITDTVMPCGESFTQDYPIGDFSQDCKVDFVDFASMAESWLKCTIPGTAGCLDIN